MLLRNKNVVNEPDAKQKNVVLFVLGATYGSRSTFDYLGYGGSWMYHMTTMGLNGWCLGFLSNGVPRTVCFVHWCFFVIISIDNETSGKLPHTQRDRHEKQRLLVSLFQYRACFGVFSSQIHLSYLILSEL